MRARLFEQGRDTLLAAADSELVGRQFEDGKACILVSERFYGGDAVDEKTLAELMDRATIGNLVGRKVIKVALSKGLIHKENVLTIGGVPHAQYVRMLKG
jgi:hypothetical protein